MSQWQSEPLCRWTLLCYDCDTISIPMQSYEEPSLPKGWKTVTVDCGPHGFIAGGRTVTAWTKTLCSKCTKKWEEEHPEKSLDPAVKRMMKKMGGFFGG